MGSMTYYHMGFDALWEYTRRNRNNYEVLSDMDYDINMCSLPTSPFGLFNMEPLDNYNSTKSYVDRISYHDLEIVFKAWCTSIEGDYSKAQKYIQAKPSYDDHSSNLEKAWDDEWDAMQAHKSAAWVNFLRQMLRYQSQSFYQQLAKYGVVFLAPSKTAFTAKQYRYLRNLYDNGTLL